MIKVVKDSNLVQISSEPFDTTDQAATNLQVVLVGTDFTQEFSW